MSRFALLRTGLEAEPQRAGPEWRLALDIRVGELHALNRPLEPLQQLGRCALRSGVDVQQHLLGGRSSALQRRARIDAPGGR